MTTLITLNRNADASAIKQKLTDLGLWTRALSKDGQTGAYELVAPSPTVPVEVLAAIEGVADVLAPSSPHPLVDAQAGRSLNLGKDVHIGPDAPLLMFAGPCSAESEVQVSQSAHAAAWAGARVLRGGAYKPRTSPYSFDGHGEQALKWLRQSADAHGLLVCTEVMSVETLSTVCRYADILQVGSRNMQNFSLLRAIGRAGRPVLLKRAMSARIDEWLLAGEYLLASGAPSVVFCERGIVGFDPQTRNLLDLGAVALLAHVYRQPVVVDPSHACGRRDLVAPLALAAKAAGAHGIMVESHPNAGDALSDGPQALDPAALARLGKALELPTAKPLFRAAAAPL